MHNIYLPEWGGGADLSFSTNVEHYFHSVQPPLQLYGIHS